MTFLALLVDNIDQSVTSSDFTHFFLFSGIASRRGLFPFKVKRGKEYKSHVEWLMNTKE